MIKEEAINQLQDAKDGYQEYLSAEACNMAIKALEQEPKVGHWYIDEKPESDREVICSNCEQPIFKYHKLDFDYRPKYCPNCGCRMIEP